MFEGFISIKSDSVDNGTQREKTVLNLTLEGPCSNTFLNFGIVVGLIVSSIRASVFDGNSTEAAIDPLVILLFLTFKLAILAWILWDAVNVLVHEIVLPNT